MKPPAATHTSRSRNGRINKQWRTLPTFRTLVLLCSVLLVTASLAVAYSSYWGSRCASCHFDDSASCNGCHRHGNRYLSASTDKSSYSPGEEVIITLDGGSYYGWIRGMLRDGDSTEVWRETGPTFTGDDGGNPLEFPIQLKGRAPGLIGNHSWTAEYYGYASSSHAVIEVPVQVTVENSAEITIDTYPETSPPFIPAGGGDLPCTVEVENTTTGAVAFDVWIDVTLPMGVHYGPILGPIHAQLPGGMQITRDLENSVPAMAPTGVYSFNVYLGDFENEIIYDADSFDFIKSP